ncbi:MAG: hypothetical protein RLZZ385_1743 [Pseudomonadota bacterium]|jgi:hypothetical chaperone protein
MNSTADSSFPDTNDPAPDHPAIGIGVDFGTSNSVAAVFDGHRVTLVRLERDTEIMPSATYIDRLLQICTGQEAIDSYIHANTGRKVELSAEFLGEARSGTGQLGDDGLPEEAATQKVFGQSFVDAGEKGRLFRGVKRLLGNSSVQRLMVFDRPFRLVALITPLLLRIHDSVQALLGDRALADHACIGHPVNFEGRAADHNSTALERLSEACTYAGFTRQRFYPEPIAAAVSYLFANPGIVGNHLLAVDFGGGTLDLCLLRHEHSGFTVIATHGIGLGGDHIDQRLFRELIFPLLGKGERWRRKGEDMEIETLFPFEDYEDLLLNWAISYMLNQNRYTSAVMSRISQGDEAAVKFRRLYELIKRNYSYLVFQSIKDVKAALSEQESAVLDIPELDIELVLQRATFEALIADLLEQFAEAVNHVLQMAGFRAEQVDMVIRTGGSSLIPAVRRRLDQQFPDKVIEHDPFTSVAAGLAIAEYRRLARELSDVPR